MSDENGGDPNSTRLLEQVMDKVDKILFAHGLEFEDEERWAEAAGELEQWIFQFYDDLTGGDEDYDPKKPAYIDSSSEAICVDECSSDEEELDEEEESSSSEEKSRPKKRAKK